MTVVDGHRLSVKKWKLMSFSFLKGRKEYGFLADIKNITICKIRVDYVK